MAGAKTLLDQACAAAPLGIVCVVFDSAALTLPVRDRSMIVTTGNEVSGRVVKEYLGVVRGIVVRSPSIPQALMGGLKQIIGGEIESYATVCENARKSAFELMVAHAAEIGAEAVIAMRYDATEFTSGVTEVLAYGTAVKLA